MRDEDHRREQPDEHTEDDVLLGDNFDSVIRIDLERTSQEPYVLPITREEVLGCQLSGITTLPDGCPVAVRLLPNVIVDLDAPQATVDGDRYELGEQSAILLKAVVEARGAWISARQIEAKYPVFDAQHADRAKRKMPEALRRLIESSTGKGHRLLD